MFFNGGRRGANVGHLSQLLPGIKIQRQTERIGHLDHAGLVGFEVHAGKPGQAFGRQVVFRQNDLEEFPDLVRGGSPVAAQAHEKRCGSQYQDFRGQVNLNIGHHDCRQTTPIGIVASVGRQVDRLNLGLGQRAAKTSMGIGDCDGIAAQQRPADQSDGMVILDGQAAFAGDHVDGGNASQIRGRGNHGLAPRHPRDAAGQFIGAPQVPGQQADHMASGLVHDHNGRILGFVAQQIDQGADDDSGGHDENVGFVATKIFDQRMAQAFESAGRHIRTVSRSGHVQTAMGEMLIEPSAQFGTALGQGPDGDFRG